MPPALPVPNQSAPLAVVLMDAASGAQVGAAPGYTVLNTAGTTTLKAGGGVFYGLNIIALGTAFTAAVYDVVGTSSNQLIGLSTAAALGLLSPAGSGLGVRFLGNLVVVTTGTPGQYNGLWD